MKLMQCCGLAWRYGQLEEGWGQSVMKKIWCNSLPETHAQPTGGSISVVVCPCICGQLEEGGGVSLS